MSDHDPWVGDRYQEGLQGQRVCIVGYSHHSSSDDPDTTSFVLRKVIDGSYADLRFFSDIMGYFGFSDAAQFWPRVMFFNFLPTNVGDADEKFSPGTNEQVASGAERAIRLYEEHSVQKAFVFTRRGWSNHPATSEEKVGTAPQLGQTPFTWGHFGKTVGIGLRHPQGARGELMRLSVGLGLQLAS